MKIVFFYNRFENLGIEILSSYLKSQGHQVTLLFDPQLFNDGYLKIKYLAKKFDYRERILNKLGKIKPDLIAFSVLTDNYRWALNLAKLIKKRHNIPIVFGGIHCTSVPDEVISNSCVDYVIRGEGEYALDELAKAIGHKKPVVNIKNLTYRKGKRIVHNKLRDFIKDLNILPFADKELFHRAIPYSKLNYTLMTARGCPFNCTYCFNHMYKKIYTNKGKYLRKRSVDNVIQELKEAKRKYGFKFVSIIDDVFMTDNEWLKDFAEKYQKEIKVPFRCIGHVNYINEENIKFLKDSGCKVIQIGIQTTSDNTRRNIIHRFETNEIIKKASKVIKRKGITFEIDHILGFPKEGIKEQIEAALFYNEIRPDIINVYWLKCFPKTDIIKYMIEDKKLSQKDIDLIEKGYFPSYIQGGSVKNIRELKKFASLFNMIPILPPKIIDFIIRKKLYNLANFGNKFMIISRIIKSIFWKDIRLIEFLSFYKHYLL